MSKIRLHGSSSGYTEIAPVAASGNNTLTLPNDGTIISKDSAGAIGITSVRATNAHFSGTTRVTTGITTTATITTGTITTAKVTTIQDSSGSNSSTPNEIVNGRAKAWIRYSIDGSGVTVLDSYGISGTSDNGTGDVIITFSTAMANDDYCWSYISGSGLWNGTNAFATTTTLRLLCMTRNDSYSNSDDECNAAVIFGEQ